MTDTMTIENFILFCDDMQVANEVSLKNIGKNVWDTIIRVFRKIATWFRNLLLNINYFKNAQLSEQMNKDLLKVLNVSQARTEHFFGILVLSYDALRMLIRSKLDTSTKFDGATLGVTGDNFYVSRSTTFKDQIHRMSVDIEENIEAAKNTSEYKRIMENDYKDEIKNIPLSNIIPDLKKCNTNLTSFENQLSKMESVANKANSNSDASKLLNMMVNFLNRIVGYYNFRISLLSKYFKAAKASLTGTANNVKELVKGDNKSRVDFKSKGKVEYKLTNPEMGKRIRDLYIDARCADTYSEYKPLYDELSSLLKCKGYAIEKVTVLDTEVTAVIVDERNNTIPLAKGQRLYHTSYNEDIIKELKPTWSTNAGVLWPTPRVYFHTNCPLDRWGNKADSERWGKHVYELKNPPSTVHVDKELGSTAIYIETNKPIPIEKIDYQEWKRIKNIDLGLDV